MLNITITFFSHTITINCVLAHVALKHFTLIIPALSFRKKGILVSNQSLSIVRLSVRPSVRTCVHHVSCKYISNINHEMEQLQTLYLDRSHAVGGTGQYFVLP